MARLVGYSIGLIFIVVFSTRASIPAEAHGTTEWLSIGLGGLQASSDSSPMAVCNTWTLRNSTLAHLTLYQMTPTTHAIFLSVIARLVQLDV